MSAILRPDCFLGIKDSGTDELPKDLDQNGSSEAKIINITDIRKRLKAESFPDDNQPPPYAVALAA